jgi:hypothetical protein
MNMKKKLLSLGMSAFLCSTMYGFDYNIVNGNQMLGAVTDMDDFSIFEDKCVNYVYHETPDGIILFYGITYTSSYDDLTHLDKGQGFVVNASGSCTVTLSDPDTIRHDDIEYKEITSPTTGKIWLDRNLGATQVCNATLESYVDVESYKNAELGCFGYYYQWGRGNDGHQYYQSNTTTIQQSSLTNTNNKFVYDIEPAKYGDWLEDAPLATRAERWRKTNGTSICPSGFRVPYKGELDAEFADPAAAVEDLKFPISGLRHFQTANYSGVGYYGALWTSEISEYEHYPRYVSFSSTGYTPDRGDASGGRPVRCIKAD